MTVPGSIAAGCGKPHFPPSTQSHAQHQHMQVPYKQARPHARIQNVTHKKSKNRLSNSRRKKVTSPKVNFRLLTYSKIENLNKMPRWFNFMQNNDNFSSSYSRQFLYKTVRKHKI